MLFRENGQFKASYRADLQMLPILQDRVFMVALVAFAFLAVPFLVSDYLFLSIIIPFLILTLAAIGLNLLVKGLYLAVATLAAQFFIDWLFARVKWFTDYSHSGSVSPAPIQLFGWTIDSPTRKYLFLLSVLVVFTVIAKNLVRGHLGRAW